MNTHTITFFCNLDLRNKWFGYKPTQRVMRADAASFEADTRLGACEQAYHLWNVNHPAHYRGPSLSVGDVLEVRTPGKGVRFYACASTGWVEIASPIEFIPDPPISLVDQLAAESARINREGFLPA
jgi:hypothetical protein